MHLHAGLFRRRQIRPQSGGDLFCQLTLQDKQVGDLAIKCVRPNVSIGSSVNELGVDAHPFPGTPHRPFQNVGHPQSGPDLPQVSRAATILANRRAADHFQIGDLGQVRKDIVLNPVRQIGVLLIIRQIFEWKHRNALVGGRSRN